MPTLWQSQPKLPYRGNDIPDPLVRTNFIQKGDLVTSKVFGLWRYLLPDLGWLGFLETTARATVSSLLTAAKTMVF